MSEHGKRERYQMIGKKLSLYHCITGRAGEGSVGARGISLLSIPKKVYRKVITERMQRLTAEKISEEHGGFRKGRGCVDHRFSFRMVVEKILAKGKIL